MSEFELNLLRQRSLEAIRQKARRGELQFRLPVGYRWTSSGKIEVDPDRRVQQAMDLIFAKVAELGSARQALLWFRREKVSLPKMTEGPGQEITWKLPVYNTIWRVLRNPMYAGAYAFGKTESRTKVVDHRARKTDGHLKPIETWMVLLRDHHAGYISWEQFERNQTMLGDNGTYEIAHGAEGGTRGTEPACWVAALSPLRAHAARCL